MVAPLIAGAARVVGSKVAQKSGQKIAVRGTRNQNSARIKNLTSRGAQNETGSLKNVSSSIEAQELIAQIPSQGDSKTGLFIRRLQAGSASLTIFWTAIGFWIPQIVFWMIGIFGLGTTSLPILDYVFPGEVVYVASYVVIAFIGLCTMAYAAFFYFARHINAFGGYKGIIFILCITGYLTLFINFFPWFIIWILAVTYMQEN